MQARCARYHPILSCATFTVMLLVALCSATPVSAQIHISEIRPDQAAPGMTIVLEIVGMMKQQGAFGSDGLLPQGTRCELIDPADTDRVIIGPLEISWNGRLAEVPMFISASASPGPVPLRLVSFSGESDVDTFYIVRPQHLPTLVGPVILGAGGLGTPSPGNVFVVDSFVASAADITFNTFGTPDSLMFDRALQPVTILSAGPIRISSSTVSVDGNGMNGGPGGGGGGHGHSGAGGYGFTGGGNSDSAAGENYGSGTPANDTSGGGAITGIRGGSSEISDQGGGGGTGCPFGRSGFAGVGNDTSRAGGYGGGSGGGEQSPALMAYGGGGGGFGTDGIQGGGIGQNQGIHNGGRFLIPFAGGSGGGAGNALEDHMGGSGGGAGGAIAFFSYDSLALADATISARGDSGTTGDDFGAGGGGGSGGGIFLGSMYGTAGATVTIDAHGGNAGKITERGRSGGFGGLGRVRIDGVFDSCESCKVTGVSTSASWLDRQRTPSKSTWIQLTGGTRDSDDLTDSIRIFYRTRHTTWRIADTVLFSTPAGRRWSKWVNAGHDSLLYVIVITRVNGPSHDFANQEPDWLMSPFATQSARHIPSPSLVSLDTLAFGPVRLDHCSTEALVISNHGDAPLRIDSATIADPIHFTLESGLPRTLAPYGVDTLFVRFCPERAIDYVSRLTLFTNDSVRPVALTGSGIVRHDSLVITPTSFNFGRVRIGRCDSLAATVRNVGTDTAFVDFRSLSRGAFDLDVTPRDSVVPPGGRLSLMIRFCPTDTGFVSAAVEIDSRRDTISMRGIGTAVMLSVRNRVELGTICDPNQIVFDTIFNRGNDTTKLLAITASIGEVGSTPLPKLLDPTGQSPFRFKLNADGTHSSDTVVYTTADTVLRTIYDYRLGVPLLRFDSLLDFHVVCLSSCDTERLALKNGGLDTIAISSENILGSSFRLLDSVQVLAPDSSASIAVIYCPQARATERDSLRLNVRSPFCSNIVFLRLEGHGTDSAVVALDVHFDATVVGECSNDSMLVENSCGPDLHIASIAIDPPFTLLPAEVPFDLTSRSRHFVHYRYCPTIAKLDSATAVLVSSSGDTVRARVSGLGVAATRPKIYLHLTGLTVQAGAFATSALVLDSSEVIGMRSVDGLLKYDASVLSLNSVNGELAPASNLPGALKLDGKVNVGVPHELATFTWAGLLGPKANSILNFQASDDSVDIVRVADGVANVVDCSDLEGHVNAAGAFSIGSLRPQPASSAVALPVTLGVEGSLSLEIRDVAGRLLESRTIGLTRGYHEISVKLDALPSGKYFARLSCQGWVQSVPISVHH